MDYAIILSALEEVSDTNGELASVTSVIGIAGVTVDKTVVVADVEADDVEEINGYSAAEHNVETSVLIFIIIVVDFGTSALRHFDKLSDRSACGRNTRDRRLCDQSGAIIGGNGRT